MIGFMAIVNSSVSTEKDVMFFFMFTDDACQDEWSVITAKMILYSELLPQFFPHVTASRYRSDGASCYSSNLARVVQVMWGVWTTITELSNRISVSGGGKSELDGRFAFLGMALRKAVNAGASHWSAKTTMEAALWFGDLHATVCATWMPVRPTDTPKVLTKGMDAFHHCELAFGPGDAVAGLRVHFTSGFGAGRLVPLVSGATSIPGGLQGRRWARHAPNGGTPAVLASHRRRSPTRPARTHAHHAQANVISSTKNIGLPRAMRSWQGLGSDSWHAKSSMTLGNRAIKKRCVTPPVCAGGLTPRPARNHLGPIGAPGRKRFGHIGSIAGARGGRRFPAFMSEQACSLTEIHESARGGATQVPRGPSASPSVILFHGPVPPCIGWWRSRIGNRVVLVASVRPPYGPEPLATPS
eukprot:COSAG04_NODE_57_length_30587_cov_86.784632_16_plen_413_part_00